MSTTRRLPSTRAQIEAYAAQEAQQSKAADEIKEEQANIKEEQAKIKEELALQQSTISPSRANPYPGERLINTKQLVDCKQTIAQQAETLRRFRTV